MNMPIMQHEAGNGFTLIELLVAIVLLAMIFTMVFGTFFYTINSAEQQEERAAIYHRVNFILNNLSQNMSSAYVPLSSLSSDEENADPAFFVEDLQIEDADADSYSAFTTNARFGGSQAAGEIAFVSYRVLDSQDVEMEEWLKDENNPLVLTCTLEPLWAQPEEDGQEPRWTQNIRSLNFEFFDGSEWLQEWNYEDQGILPEAVKIHLEVADSEGVTYAFSTTTRVHVNALIEEPPDEEEIEEIEEVDEEELEEEITETTPEETEEPSQEKDEPSEG